MSELPEMDVVRVQRWCRAHVPDDLRDQIRIEVDATDRHLTIMECRPPWSSTGGGGDEWTRLPVARLRYTKTTRLWSLYWRDRNLKFHLYDQAPATAIIDELLAEVDRDSIAIFWG